MLQLPLITELKIHRCYSLKMKNSKKIEMHIFCDASQKVFAAVAYFRILSDAGIEISFVMSKSRAAPLRPSFQVHVDSKIGTPGSSNR